MKLGRDNEALQDLLKLEDIIKNSKFTDNDLSKNNIEYINKTLSDDKQTLMRSSAPSLKFRSVTSELTKTEPRSTHSRPRRLKQSSSQSKGSTRAPLPARPQAERHFYRNLRRTNNSSRPKPSRARKPTNSTRLQPGAPKRSTLSSPTPVSRRSRPKWTSSRRTLYKISSTTLLFLP